MSVPVNQKQVIVDQLRKYVDMGMPVIPLCSHDHKGFSEKHMKQCACAGKSPITKGWPDHAVTTKEQIKSWLSEFRSFNIGMPMGHPSGYIGVDVDGVLGQDMLDEMSDGDVPDTWSYRTGDGYRLLYTIPIGMTTKKYVNQDKDNEHTECSILAYGQQTVLPPSVHHTGRLYAWDEGHDPLSMDCAPAPDWLLDLVRDDSGRARGAGTIDLTSNSPTYTPPEKEKSDVIDVQPLLITDATEHTYFVDPVQEFDDRVPDGTKKGKSAKAQETTIDIMNEIFTQGGRDQGMTKLVGHLCATQRGLGKDMIMVLAKAKNQTNFVPPLDDIAIEAKVNHIWEKEEAKSAEYKARRSESEDRKQFVSYSVAQVALNLMEDKGDILKISPDRKSIWVTNKSEGPWTPMDATSSGSVLAERILPALVNPEYGGQQEWVSPKNVSDTIYALALQLKEQHRVWDTNILSKNTQSLSGHQYIPLKGGKLLNWRNGELLPWDPETHLTYTLPIEYDPDASCPNWDMRLKEWLPEEESRMVVQEFIGYSFIPYMGFEKIMILQGEGANGKSMFLETITEMFATGDPATEVIGSSTLNDIGDKFGKIDLLGKIINIANESGADYLKGDGADELKNLISGGSVNGQVKHGSTVRFTNTAKFVFSSNHDIKTGDKSHGWERRLILVPFTQNFTNSGVSKHEIMESFKNEYPGIFNWALEGLRRLVSKGKFTESEVITQKLNKYTASNDVPTSFYQGCLRDIRHLKDESGRIGPGTPTAVIADLFEKWCKHVQSDMKKHKARIKEHLEKRGYEETRRKGKEIRHSNAAATKCWVGLDIHITDDDFLESCLDPMCDYAVMGGPLRDYMIKRLEELNNETLNPTPPGGSTVDLAEAK